MAIKKGLNPRLAEIGKIKIGGKGEEKTSQNRKKFRQPIKFDHFKVVTTERGPDGNFLPDEAVMKAVGEKEPKELRIRFPFDDIDMNFYTSYQCYNGAKLVCKGDGEKAERRDKDGVITEEDCNLDTCKQKAANKCKVSGILSCFLPDSPSYGGVYRFRTHGWNSVGGILAALKGYSEYTGGILQGLPFKLKMIKKATEEHGNVNVVALVLDGVELDGMRRLAIEEKRGRKELDMNMKQIELDATESGFTEDTDDPEDVEAEFYADAEDDESGTSAEEVKAELEGEEAAGEPDAETDAGEPGKDLF